MECTDDQRADREGSDMLDGLLEALLVIVPAVLIGSAIGWMLKKLRGDNWRYSVRGMLFATALIAIALYVLISRWQK
jgi:hypothetical protein